MTKIIYEFNIKHPIKYMKYDIIIITYLSEIILLHFLI